MVIGGVSEVLEVTMVQQWGNSERRLVSLVQRAAKVAEGLEETTVRHRLPALVTPHNERRAKVTEERIALDLLKCVKHGGRKK